MFGIIVIIYSISIYLTFIMCGVVFWVFSVVWLECTCFDVFERYIYKIRNVLIVSGVILLVLLAWLTLSDQAQHF